MRCVHMITLVLFLAISTCPAGEPPAIVQPDAFETLINPACSHCRDEAKRRSDLKAEDSILAWIRGYSDGGAIPVRFFLAPHRVISDSYGVFVYDPDAGFARGFSPSYEFRFYGWRNGIMVMRHKDGTLYSCLSGVAFDGPRKGTRLKPIPTLVSQWGWWLDQYPGAVAYHMFDKFQPTELPCHDNPDSVKSRPKPDTRLRADQRILGVWTGKVARAYSLEALERRGFVQEELDGQPLVVFWEPSTRTASAYRPIASQPRKYKAPQPDAAGVSPPDEGVLIPPGAAVVASRKLTLGVAPKAAGRFQDAETRSIWDVTGRCIEGQLKGFTLEWVDGVQVKWFAWAAEHPETSILADQKPAPANRLRRLPARLSFCGFCPSLLPR